VRKVRDVSLQAQVGQEQRHLLVDFHGGVTLALGGLFIGEGEGLLLLSRALRCASRLC
jgi:hypothetical protein